MDSFKRHSIIYIIAIRHSAVVNVIKWLTNNTFVSGSNDSSLIIWNSFELNQVCRLTGSGGVSLIEILQNEIIASGSYDNAVRLWFSC